MPAQLVLVSPPALKGRTNERSQSGGLGVSRKLKPFEKESPEIVPHDFLYQAAVAERSGHSVRILDLLLERVTDHRHGLAFVRQTVKRGSGGGPEPLWIGVRISITSLRSDVRFANEVKEAFPHARVYGFGSVIMATYRHWIADARFDYLFYGEPEAIIADALGADDPRSVEGVISVADFAPQAGDDLFNEEGVAEYLGWRKVPDLESLPRAAWHLANIERYAAKGDVSNLGLQVEASRGCFMPCTMCPYNLIEGRAMRFRRPESVLAEIEYLHRTFGTRHIQFRDPNFSANKAQLRALCNGIISLGLPIDFSAELSLELLDRELLTLMSRAGIRTILTGVESDVPEIMHTLGQNTKINRILEEKVPICTELGIHVYGFFLIGSPEETWHTVKRTWTFAKSLGVEATMTILTPFPGTPVYWRAHREELLAKGSEMTYEDWNSYTATLRTYRMSLRDVKLARTWARLETYVPYLRNAMKQMPARRRARTCAHLAPRVAALMGLRVYAAWKLRRETGSPVGSSPIESRPMAPQRLIAEADILPVTAHPSVPSQPRGSGRR